MSRYIDIEPILEWCDNPEVFEPYGVNSVELERKLRKAPTIDIVHCSECKYWERLNYEAPKEGWCDDQMPYSDGRWVDADDFCSYGEREGE